MVSLLRLCMLGRQKYTFLSLWRSKFKTILEHSRFKWILNVQIRHRLPWYYYIALASAWVILLNFLLKNPSNNRSPSQQELLNHSAVQLRASDSGLVKPDCSGHCWACVLWQAPFHCLKFSQATARPVCLFHMTDSQLCAFVSLCLSARQVRLSEGE